MVLFEEICKSGVDLVGCIINPGHGKPYSGF